MSSPVRSRLIGCRTQLCNQIRGLLAEYGIELSQHISQVRKALVQVTEEAEGRLSPSAKNLFVLLYAELCELELRIDELEARVAQAFRRDPLCQRIAAVEGIGPVTARLQLLLRLRTEVLSTVVDSSRRGSGWFRGSIRAETNNG